MRFEPHELATAGLPESSWWAEADATKFYEQAAKELGRMRCSKEHRRMGLPMVIAAIDGKGQRTS